MGPRCLPLCATIGSSGGMERWKDGYEEWGGGGGGGLGRSVCANINNSGREGEETPRVKVSRNLMIGSFCRASVDFQTHHLWLVTLVRSYQSSTSLQSLDLLAYDGNWTDCIMNCFFFFFLRTSKFQHGRSSVPYFSQDRTIWCGDRNRQYIGLLWYWTPPCVCVSQYILIYIDTCTMRMIYFRLRRGLIMTRWKENEEESRTWVFSETLCQDSDKEMKCATSISLWGQRSNEPPHSCIWFCLDSLTFFPLSPAPFFSFSFPLFLFFSLFSLSLSSPFCSSSVPRHSCWTTRFVS